MRKRQLALRTAIACCAVVAVCGASLLIAAEPASVSRSADRGTQKLSKMPTPPRTGAAPAAPVGGQEIERPLADPGQPFAGPSTVSEITPPAASPVVPDSGLRDLGDTDITLYSALDPTFRTYFTGAPTNDRGLVFFPGNNAAPSGQAYVIESITFPFSRISVAGTTTYAKIVVGEAAANVPTGNCVDGVDALINPVRATVIVNLGAATNNECDFDNTTEAPTDDLDVAVVNLLTGQVTSGWNGAVIGSVVLNTATNVPGYGRAIPAGDGELAQAIGIKMGVLSGVCPACTVVDAPADDCVSEFALTGGAGLVWMNWIAGGCPTTVFLGNQEIGPNGELGFGRLITGVWVDAVPAFGGNGNGIWECGEGFWCGTTVSPGLNAKMDGAMGPDCDTNGVVDAIDIAGGAADINGDGVPDSCGLTDCDANLIPDMCDLSCANIVPNAPDNVGPNGEGPWTPGLCSAGYPGCGTALDCNGNARVDSCEADCNNNNIPDDCDLSSVTSQDCNGNAIPDECDVASGDPDGDGDVWRDCDADLIPDGCQFFFTDCNRNNISDNCDIDALELNDYNANSAPDVCEALGRTVVLDFEETDPDFDYVLGAVHDQPYALLVESTADWLTFDDKGGNLATMTNTGYADVVNGSLVGGGKSLLMREIATNGVPTDDWATMTPHVFFADPDIETVSAFLPLYQEMSLKVKFNMTNDLSAPPDGKPDTNLDWDVYFGSVFDVADNTFFVNDYRVLVTFKSQTDSNGFPTEIWVAGSGGYIRTGVDWATNLNTVHDLRVVIDLRNQTGQNVTNAAKVYWDGNLISTFTPGISVSNRYVMDKIYFDQYRNTEEIGFGGGTMQVDDITLIRDREGLDCSLFLSEDCNGDGVCDVYQLATGDLDDNGALDICEGFCPDCNHNSIIDTVEIALGSAPDTNANDVIDWCEKTTHATGFEAANSWALGLVHGQNGWRETDGGASEVTSTAATAWPRQGTQYLRVQKNPDTNRNFDIIYAPRQDALGDADIEIWSWDWTYTNQGFFQLAVELGDLCTDILDGGVNDGNGTGDRTPAGSFDEAEWIDSANVGVSLFCNVPNATPAEVGKTRVFALQSANGVHEYLEVAGILGNNIHQSFFQFDNWNSAGLKVMNQRGQYDILWGRAGQTQTTMIANQLVSYTSGGTRLQRVAETRRARTPRYPSSQPINEGGDRQMVIRVAARSASTLGETTFPSIPPFGEDGTSAFFFDDFRYATGKDCDADGVIDANFLAGFPTYDRNADGIPDNCQDCDDDCGPFPIAVGAVACLDPNEAVGNDCNANGLQDSCDVDPNRPFVNKIDTAGCYDNDNFLPNGECFEARAGGGSCDLDTNGVPDECQGADCNGNGCLDSAEINVGGGTGGIGGPLDVDNNGVPDECQPDCNNNGNPDSPKTTPNTDLNVGNTGGDGSQDNWPYFGNPLQIGDGIPDECCVVCTGLPGGFPWNDQCQVVSANGDLDRDGDVDAYDFKFVQRCASDEPANPANPFPHPRGTVVGSATGGVNWDGISCGCADFNGDGVVDGIDANLLQTVVTGPE